MSARKHKQRRAVPPMIVMRTMFNKDLETKELAAVRAFQWGGATEYHYTLLMDMANMLFIAGSTDDSRTYGKEYAVNKAIPALDGIRQRHIRTGKLGVNAQELQVLVELVEFSKQFWMRQPIELYKWAGEELLAYKEELAQQRAAA
jgi:hypothetical protein